MNKEYPTFFLTWFNKILRVPYPGIPKKHSLAVLDFEELLLV